MITALLILNIILLTTIITMVVFLRRNPKPLPKQIDKQLEREKAERIRTINSMMNYNVETARRANRG